MFLICFVFSWMRNALKQQEKKSQNPAPWSELDTACKRGPLRTVFDRAAEIASMLVHFFFRRI